MLARPRTGPHATCLFSGLSGAVHPRSAVYPRSVVPASPFPFPIIFYPVVVHSFVRAAKPKWVTSVAEMYYLTVLESKTKSTTKVLPELFLGKFLSLA